MTVEEIRSGIESRGSGELNFLCYFVFFRQISGVDLLETVKSNYVMSFTYKGPFFLDPLRLFSKFSKPINYYCQMSLNPEYAPSTIYQMVLNLVTE